MSFATEQSNSTNQILREYSTLAHVSTNPTSYFPGALLKPEVSNFSIVQRPKSKLIWCGHDIPASLPFGYGKTQVLQVGGIVGLVDPGASWQQKSLSHDWRMTRYNQVLNGFAPLDNVSTNLALSSPSDMYSPVHTNFSAFHAMLDTPKMMLACKLYLH